MAQATMAYHAGLTGSKDQFIRWNDPFFVDAGARFFLTKIQWLGDGQTFEVHPVYADNVPGQYDGKGPRWPDAGKPVGHSSAPIFVQPVGGQHRPTKPCYSHPAVVERAIRYALAQARSGAAMQFGKPSRPS